MILYDLSCPDDHRFESWFRNSGAVEKLIKAGQVVCPVCGSKKVQKAPMAPMIGKTGIAKSSDDAPHAKSENTELTAAMEKAAAAFTELRNVIEKNFDNVGDKFPEEARRIHYGEAKKRGIYGDATPKETEALREEGIEVYAIPWNKRSNAN
ncbi:MAG: DUF1178 family protein [Rhodospirillaceae bacterium]|nr:DUF1178 family protein [Rhodospirillaceae bacterium]